jgi:opacity protein-like surface antigen
MKKLIVKMFVILAITGLFSCNLSAQNKMYAHINVGYGLKMASQSQLADYTHTIKDTLYLSNDKAIDVSFGKGLNIGASFGYMFNKNFGAELGVNYLLGGKTKATADITETFMGITSHEISDRTFSATMIRMVPSLVVDAGFEKVDPYAKVGLVIGIGSIKRELEENKDGDLTKVKFKLNGGVSLGISSAIGVKYNISEMMSVFAELNMVNMSYAPAKEVMTEYTLNGVDQLPNFKTNEKETEFVKEIDYDSNAIVDQSKPTKQLHQKLPFSSYGLNLGFRINF